ncbi:heavy-metal-associated domain-containing protein [Flavobacterium sp. UBA6135]|uniref:heavy-metal-associated domain-containing protein n=1 Tax=Flavobacterium sp. UBA6135 TaxID=1946553 RepID=UPI0025C66D82|nr:heavy-metal-associated domain-containing protein [Flavobacterium sp. UBA6135]
MRIPIYILLLLMSLSTAAQISKIEIQATGLTCSMCSNAINKQLKSLSDVENVTTDLNTNTFVVFLKPNNNFTPKTFKDSVEKAGFFIGTMVVTLDSSYLQSHTNQFIALEDKTVTSSNEAVIRILDKGYVTQKEYKKLQKKYAKVASYNGVNEEVFHYKFNN